MHFESLKIRWQNIKKWFSTTDFNPYTIQNTRYLKLIVSIYPAIAAVLLAFYKEPIVESTRRAKQYILHDEGRGIYTFSLSVFLYWSILFLWLCSYFFFVSNENNANKITTSSLKSAIFRAPNANIFGLYELYYKEIRNLTIEICKTNANEVFTRETCLNAILKNICELTSTFTNTTDPNIIYGASVMIYIPLKLHPEIITKLRSKPEEWIHFRKTEIDTFNGVLHLIPTLSYKTGNTVKPTIGLTSITLPVISNENKALAVSLNIPGAPIAAIDERFLFSNVKSEKSYSHLGAVEIENAKNYWENKLPSVNSVMSFGIPYDWTHIGGNDIVEIIGVINIDSTNIDILGTEREYFPTYTSLLYPILCQLSPILFSFYQLTINDLALSL